MVYTFFVHSSSIELRSIIAYIIISALDVYRPSQHWRKVYYYIYLMMYTFSVDTFRIELMSIIAYIVISALDAYRLSQYWCKVYYFIYLMTCIHSLFKVYYSCLL